MTDTIEEPGLNGLLLTSLPLPSVILGGEPLEFLAWNRGFANQFLSSDETYVDRTISTQIDKLLPEIVEFSRDVFNEKKTIVSRKKSSNK